MLKIKLSRTGQKKQPHYRIIVAEDRSKRDGKFLENLGHYIPFTDPAQLQLNITAFDSWLAKGAQPTSVVRALRSKTDSDKLVTFKKTPKTKAKKAKAA